MPRERSGETGGRPTRRRRAKIWRAHDADHPDNAVDPGDPGACHDDPPLGNGQPLRGGYDAPSALERSIPPLSRRDRRRNNRGVARPASGSAKIVELQRRARKFIEKTREARQGTTVRMPTSVVPHDDMSTIAEELRVAEEELWSQADELIAARNDLEAERLRYRELFDF